LVKNVEKNCQRRPPNNHWPERADCPGGLWLLQFTRRPIKVCSDGSYYGLLDTAYCSSPLWNMMIRYPLSLTFF